MMKSEGNIELVFCPSWRYNSFKFVISKQNWMDCNIIGGKIPVLYFLHFNCTNYTWQSVFILLIVEGYFQPM